MNNYRYPGSRPFNDSELDRRLFFGRDEEIKYLFHSILVENLFVLFAKSGMGKTSLLNAGLMEPLRIAGFIPLVIRLNDRNLTPAETIYAGIKEAVGRQNERSNDQGKIDYEPGEQESLWQYFKTVSLWSPDDKSLTPILIFDQFEEFFTIHNLEARELFSSQLADLVRGRVPTTLRKKFKEKGRFPYSSSPPKVKVVISIREDCIGNLDELSRDLPNILKKSYRLLPLTCQQAKDAIIRPAQLTEDDYIHSKGFSYAPEAVEKMLNFLCALKGTDETVKKREVEPFQLQLLCRNIEEKTGKQAGDNESEYIVQVSDLGGIKGMKKVLEGFYENRIKTMGSFWQRRRVRKLCEKGLIDYRRRVSLPKESIERKYKVSDELLFQLVDSRLLRSEAKLGTVCYELSHDTMVGPILRYHRRKALEKIWITAWLLLFFAIIGANFIRTQINRYMTIDSLYKEAGELKQLQSYKQAIERYKDILKISPKRVSLYMEIGGLFEQTEKYDNAIKNYKKALEFERSEDKKKIIHYRLGKIYLEQKKDPEKAFNYYREAIGIDPKNDDFHTALGDAFLQQSKFENAEEEFEQALELENRNAEAYKGLAFTYINQGRPEEAINIYRRAVRISVDFADFYKYIALEFKKIRETEHLETLYLTAYEVGPQKAAYYRDLADDFNSLQKHKDVITCYNKALELGDKSEFIYERLAITYLYLRSPDEAISVYREAVTVNPDFADIYGNIARSMRKTKMGGELDRLYQAASMVQTDDSAYYEKLGYAFASLKEYNRAIENYNKALALDPKRASIYSRLAILYVNQGNPGSAIDVFIRAVKVDVKYAYIIKHIDWKMKSRNMKSDRKQLHNRAYSFKTEEIVYYEQLGKFFNYLKEYYLAAVTFRKVTRLDPGDAAAWKKQGLAYRKSGNYSKAIDCYENAIKHDSKEASTYHLLGIAYGRTGRYKEAIKSYRKALQLDPGSIITKANLAEVTLLEGYYSEADKISGRLLRKPDISTMHKLGMRYISIASAIFQGRRSKARSRFYNFIDYYKSISDYSPGSYHISKKFIKENESLEADKKEFLLELIEILEAPQKVDIQKLEELESKAQRIFNGSERQSNLNLQESREKQR